MKRLKTLFYQITTFFILKGIAFADYDIGKTDSDLFKKINTFMQDTVNFTVNQVATTVVFLGLSVALYSWYNKPEKSEWLAKSVRGSVAAILILALALVIKYFKDLT